jgi:hypothetical protein
MRLYENPDRVEFGSTEISYEDTENYSFILGRLFLLGSTRADCASHAKFSPVMEALRRNPSLDIHELLAVHGMVLIGTLGPVRGDFGGHSRIAIDGTLDYPRIFPQELICSFWELNLLKWLPPHLNLLAQYFSILQLPIDRFVFEAGARSYQELITFKQLQNPDRVDQLADPETEKLNRMRAELHVMPPGPQKDALRRKLDGVPEPAPLPVGFNSRAAYNFARVGESARKFLQSFGET